MGLLYDLTVNCPQSAPKAEASIRKDAVCIPPSEDTPFTASYANILFAAPLAMESCCHSAENTH